MYLNLPKEEIARDLQDQARKVWGHERAEALKPEIDKVAGWVSLIATQPLALDAAEPDFLLAPSSGQEA